MSKWDLIFQDIFGSDENDGRMLLDAGDQMLSKFVYGAACEESANQTKSETTSNEEREAIMKNFDLLIDLFEDAVKAKKLFLDTFQECAPHLRKLIEQLKEISKSVENIKCCSKGVLILSGIIGTLSALALCFACPVVAPVAGPALAVTCVVMAGASLTEHFLKKRKLKEANILINQIQSELKNMAHWFEYPDELKKAFGLFINYTTLIEINNDLQKFFTKNLNQVKLTAAEFKNQLKDKLKMHIKEMMKDSKIAGLDDEIKPIVITFLVVCLIKGQHQFVLDSIGLTLKAVYGVLGVANAGRLVCEFLAGMEGVAAKVIANLSRLLAPVAFIINLFVLASSAKELSKTSKLAQQINDNVHQFETSFELLESVYNGLKEFEKISEADVIQWTSVIVQSVPHDAQRVHIKKAFKNFLPKEAHGCIKMERLTTGGNNWLIKVPQSHSQHLLEQNFIEINKQRCAVIK